jgi:hypothetical protein
MFVGHLSFACRVCYLFTVATDVAHNSVFSGQWKVENGKWEAIEIMAAIDNCHNLQYSPT